MVSKFSLGDVQEYFKQKYSLLNCNEIMRLGKTKDSASWDEWYIALQSYANAMGGEWDYTSIIDCGSDCWRESYNNGMEVSDAFGEGFSE